MVTQIYKIRPYVWAPAPEKMAAPHRRKHPGGRGGRVPPPEITAGGRQCYSSPQILATSDMCCVMNMIAYQAMHNPPLCFRPQSPRT